MYNSHAIEKVLTGLYLDNDLLANAMYPLRLEDFVEKKYQGIYSALYNLYILGNNNIDISDIVGWFRTQQGLYEKFVTDGGMDTLYQICNDTTSNNFDYNYGIIKKQTLLRDLTKLGIDISDLYDKNASPEDFEKQMAKFNAMDIDDVFRHYENKITGLQSKYNNLLEKTCIHIGDGLEELFKQLQSNPETGYPLEGDIYNTVTRGARLKKLYIDSGASGSGKSRRMVGNAAHLSIPMFCQETLNEVGEPVWEWTSTGLENKVLYITTELEHAEIQTLILAYVSGVNEDKILNNKCSEEEKDRIKLAIEYIEAYNNLIVEYLPNPTLASIQTIIKKHVLQDNVEYVFYDYIHISAGLTEGRDKNTRDDVILMLLSDTLKNLANELNIHISSATQLNGDYEEKEVKNQNLLRGSKAIADKADVGAITLPVEGPEYELGKAYALQLSKIVPNFITDIYKNRRGKWTAIRIWRYIDLGTCRTTDCFITNRQNEMIEFDTTKIKTEQASKVSGFVVIDKPDPYKDFGQQVRIEEDDE